MQIIIQAILRLVRKIIVTDSGTSTPPVKFFNQRGIRMSDLSAKKCVPCEGGVKPLDRDEIEEYLEKVSDWSVEPKIADGREVDTIMKKYTFKDFRQAMSFLRTVEEIAEEEGHHPDFCLHYNKIDFRIWTHAIGGLHENDFILASKIDRARDFLD